MGSNEFETRTLSVVEDIFARPSRTSEVLVRFSAYIRVHTVLLFESTALVRGLKLSTAF